jgi:multidrug efflux pump
VRVEVDQDKARALGITSLNIEQALQASLEGLPITRYREGDRVLDVVTRLSPDERGSLDRLSQISVPTASGQAVPLASCAPVTELRGRRTQP